MYRSDDCIGRSPDCMSKQPRSCQKWNLLFKGTAWLNVAFAMERM